MLIRFEGQPNISGQDPTARMHKGLQLRKVKGQGSQRFVEALGEKSAPSRAVRGFSGR